jgi:restriction endonuclease Mrr
MAAFFISTERLLMMVKSFNGKIITVKFSQAVEELADEFSLTQEEHSELLPSGSQAVFNNRVGWARTKTEYTEHTEYTEVSKLRKSLFPCVQCIPWLITS